jgi:hypothetical protein
MVQSSLIFLLSCQTIHLTIIVFLYDVLDHAIDAEQAYIKEAHRCLAPNGTVYVRCHPWTSKHATHLYKQGINKAYFHLFLTWDEIRGVDQSRSDFSLATKKSPWMLIIGGLEALRLSKIAASLSLVHEFFQVPAFKELLVC